MKNVRIALRVSGVLCSLTIASSAAVVNLTDETFGSAADPVLPSVRTVSTGPNAGTSFRGGIIEGALFREFDGSGSTGSGTFRDLFRVSPPNGSANVTESGYNRVAMDTDIPNGFDPNITVGDLVLDSTGNNYVFAVDINEANNAIDRFISLDDFKVWVDPVKNDSPTDDPIVPGAGDTLPGSLNDLNAALGLAAYDMNPAGASNSVLMDATHSSGSGGGDLLVFVPKALFGNADPSCYVYVFASFGEYSDASGADFGAGSTQEQVAMPPVTSGFDAGITVPEPAQPMLLIGALINLVVRRSRKS